MTEEEAIEEIVNNALFSVDIQSPEFESFMKEHMTLAEAILEKLQEWLKNLEAFFGTVTGMREVEALRGDLEYMQEVAERVEEILAKNGKNIAKSEENVPKVQKNSTTDGGAKYQLADNFDEEFDKAIDVNNTYYKNNVFVLGEMPPLYAQFGLDTQLPLTITSKHLRNAVAPKNIEKHQHGLSKPKIKNAVLQLSHPAVVMFDTDGVLFVTVNETDSDQIPITFVIKPNGSVMFQDQLTDANHSLSVYSRENTYYFIEKKVKANEVLLANKNEVHQAEQSLGRQFSNRLLTGDFTANIAQYKKIVKQNQSKKLVLDRDYMQAARNGDEEKAAEYVEQAAKEWGAFSDGKPAPINFYHGTKSFGFTWFDLQKMDDGRSIFLTSDEMTAQSYSSADGIRRIIDAPKDVDYRNMNKEELVTTLNKYSVFNKRYNIKYEYWSKNKIDDILSSENTVKDELINACQKLKEITNLSQESIKKINKLMETAFLFDIKSVSANLYLALNGKNAFLEESQFKDIYDRIYKVSVFSDIKEDISDGAIVENMDGYLEVISKKEAHSILNHWTSNTAGNYSLYAKFNNPFVIDNKGNLWNEIKLTDEQRKNLLPKGTMTRMSDFISRLEKQWDLDEGWISVNDFISNTKESREKVDAFKKLIHSAHINEFDTTGFPWGEYSNGSLYLNDLKKLTNFNKESYTTRQIAERAQNAGYDGVVFKNILDNGGRGMKDPGVADYIAVAFDSSQVKSADPITYDDNGEIIPLSERFSESKDIRYSVKDETLQASAAKHFGTTYNWNETGYILTNGKRLDFSGKNYGARGGSRTVDHRDIDEVYNDELSGTEAMIDFINRGNIRIMPEVGGVELSAVPTKAQKEALDSFISKNRGEITLDISDENGDNLLSIEYPRGTFSKKILNDIEQYFENGTEPYISDTARYRYSVLDRNDIQKALDKRERQIFYSAINPLTQNDGLRIGENGILIPSEDEADTYKLIHYTNIGSVQVHDVYKLINHDYNIHEIIPDVAKHIIELREEGYNEKHTQSILKSFSSLYGTVFKKYSPKSHRFVNYARSGNRNGTVNRPQPTGTGFFERIRQNGSGAKQLVYDTALTDTILEQEAELARAARESGAYKSAVSKRQSFGDKIALIRRQMNTTFKTPTYRPEAVAKVADGFLKEYGVTDILSKDEKQTFTAALHKMYQQLDGAHGLGYLDEQGKYHKPHANAAELADAYAEQAINTIREYMTAANDTQLDDRLQEIKDYFAAKKVVKLTSVQWQELLHLYGSAKEANKDVPYIRFAKAQAGEQNTLDDHWQELNLGSDVNEGDQVPRLIEMLKDIREATAATVNYFEQDEDQTELMNEAVFRLQSTWAEVQWQETFADRQKASVALAKQMDEQTATKGGKKANRNMAQLAQYKKSLEETMRYSEKAIADLQKAYAKENERTLATLSELGAALAAERENSAGLKQDLGEAKANRNAVENKSRELTKTVDELKRQNTWLGDFVEQLTEKQKQLLVDYARTGKELQREHKKVLTRERWLAEYKAKVKESRKAATERKRQTELKNKLRRKFMKVASLAAANEKKRHVPNGLINATKDMLQAFNIYTPGTKVKVQFDSYLSRIGTAFTRAVKDENYEAVYGGYSEFINTQIQNIRDTYGVEERSLSEMSIEELEDINDLINSVMKFITDGNNSFANNIKENIDELQDKTVAELKESNVDKKQEHDRKNSLKQLLVDNMKPVYFFRQAGSATLEKLFTNVYDGENTWANDITEARDKEQELREKYHYYDWNQKEKHSFQLEREKQTLELNVQQIMTLYALSRREDAQGKLVAWDHLLEGGIRKLNGTEARRGFMQSRKLKLDEEIYKFTEKDIKTIVNTLTDEQKHFVQEAQEFLSVDVAKWGNAVSEKLYDVHLFKGKIYFPMQSDKQWVEEKEKKTTGARQIKNFGASQALIKHANNPLVLGEFNDVFGNHIDEMALYHAFVLPLEDMQRVYGYYSTKKNSSVRHLLGRYNRTYIDQLLQDLNGGVKASGDLDFGSRMVSRWKKVSVALNSSVIIQQPSAIGRAFAYIEPKYFKPALPTEKNLEEMMVYAPIARIKSMGYFDVDLGRTATEFINENEYSGLKAKGKAVFTDRNYRENLLTIGAEKADELTWAQIWSAAKQKAKAQGFTGEAQLEKAGEIFTECIRMTQVYDSVFTRSGNMRKKGFLASAATAFMSEPTTAYNMVVDAFSGLKSGRTTKKFAASVAASVLTATVINAMLKAVVQSLRHADDDDDIIEQYPGEVLGNILDDINPISYIPILKDVYSAFAGNDIERPDMTLISDFAGKIKKVIADPKDGARWVDLAATSAQIFGIPTVSVVREFRQAKNLLSHIFTDERTRPTAEGVLVNIENSIAESLPISSQIAKGAGAEHFLQQNSSDYALIYRLIQSGDQKEAMKRFDILKKSDPEKFTDKTLQSGIRNLLKKDRDITEAAILWNQGKAQEARAKLDAESLKNFDMNDKLAATIAKAKELKPVPASTKASDKDYNDDFDTGAIKNTEYAQKAAQGILDADYYAIEENFNALVQMGYSEKQAQKAIVSMANELGQEQEDYISATTTRSLKKNALLNDSDVTAAAEAAHAGRIEERASLQDKLISKGYTMNEVGAAIDYMEKKLYPTDKGDDSSEEKTYYTYRTSDVASYLAAGDTESAAAVTSALVDEYERAGKTADSAKEAIRKAITAEFKEKYRNGSDTEREKIRQLMYASGAYKNGFGVVSATKWWLK